MKSGLKMIDHFHHLLISFYTSIKRIVIQVNQKLQRLVGIGTSQTVKVKLIVIGVHSASDALIAISIMT